MSQLDGKVAIVTGGGRGIGRAHALALARAGAAVVVNDLGTEFSGEGEANRGPADKVVQAIRSAGGRAIADGNDISDWDAADKIVEAAVKEFGRLDIVVNNAAISRFGTIDSISRRDWDQVIAVNLTGTAALCHAAAKYWRAKGAEAGRRIINTSSGVGLTPIPGNPMYAASKAGVAALTISLSIELAELGVRVNGISPIARTRVSEFVAGARMPPAVEQGFDRMSPDHIAALVAYLASPACRFTGRIIGAIGDDLTLWEGWSVSHHADNGEEDWTAAGMEKALADFPIQQNVQTQWIKGVKPAPSPDQLVLDALAAVEAVAVA
ncbi:SDR family NAD(P)-dependent oxidoreductase [Sphingobium sp.]|uniref:SDR family NAD(P)-dependent oxidoreductase n=1 Tax=Sphingobium sp. TaxID=1912891 RepID=UPI0028BF33EF|nr:SDR family NAD(P)-dependent oxidoreductase [Sphingobium sp.]